jgi:hypothetical protein
MKALLPPAMEIALTFGVAAEAMRAVTHRDGPGDLSPKTRCAQSGPAGTAGHKRGPRIPGRSTAPGGL